MIEREVTIESGGVTLAGTLTLPDEGDQFQSVVMVHGSGPLDRDENLKSQRLDVFNTFASAFADEGIASLRYDKRGCGKSGGDYYRAGHVDLVEDAAAAWECLKRFPELDPARRYLLGHSEGTVIVPQVTATRADVPGLVLLCPFIEPMESVLVRQARQIVAEIESDKTFMGRVRNLLARLVGMTVKGQAELIEKVKNAERDVIRIRGRRFAARWLRELIELDLETVYSNCRAPMLSVCGAKDVQCLPGDGERIAAISPAQVENHVVDNLSHVLRYEQGEARFMRTPALLKEPVEPDVVNLVTSWLKEHGGR